MIWAAKYYTCWKDSAIDAVSSAGIFVSERFRFLKISRFLKKPLCRCKRYVRFYQTVTHYGMIKIYHPSIRHMGKKAPFGLPLRKSNLSHTLSLKILKAKSFPFPALRFSTARFTLLYLRSPPSRCIPANILLDWPDVSLLDLVQRFIVGARPSSAWINSHKITKMCYNLPIIFNYVKTGRLLWLNTRYTIVHMI